ncbi:MAG: FAD-dependent oxidoreductase, partial [Actinomycetota bacterium]|nr:FAD-dependent oxidoreductase [Actinomycetota bacterium]
MLGTGAAGLVAAVAAADAGADVTVVEKGHRVGGTTALSGGTTWIPAVEGGREEALAYLESLSHSLIDPELAATFVDTGPEFLDWVADRTPVRFHPVPGLPDYHPEHPGGKPKGGRSLDPDLLRVGALGEWADRIVMPERTPRLMLTEAPLGGGRGVAPGWPDRARRKAEDWRGCGHALVGGLLAALLERGIEPRLGSGAVELLHAPNEGAVRAVTVPEGAPRSGWGRVAGVRLADRTEIAADAVVIATGGFEWDQGLVAAHLRGPMTSPASVPTNTGDGLRMAMAAGAALGTMREAWWVPTIEVPGAARPELVLPERTRPGSIMVNRTGRRFANEAANYNALGGAFHQFDPTAFRYANLPCWLVFDAA